MPDRCEANSANIKLASSIQDERLDQAKTWVFMKHMGTIRACRQFVLFWILSVDPLLGPKDRKCN